MSKKIREEEVKNKLSDELFWLYDCTKVLGDIDYSVSMYQNNVDIEDHQFLLWAEAKKGNSNLYNSFVQLVLTIGKAKTFNTYLPPAFLGVFDENSISFIEYNVVQPFFYKNDFNWNVRPSDHKSKEFLELSDTIRTTLDENCLVFDLNEDSKILSRFIKQNFKSTNHGVVKIRVDKNNFVSIYNKWLKKVRDSISVDWSIAKKNNIIDGDFYLADLLSENDLTLKDRLFVLLKKDYYLIDQDVTVSGLFSSKRTDFKDNQQAHKLFWNRYSRPPKEEYWDYMVQRRDLLVPQDVRERKGSYFTPQIWVELAHDYLAAEYGENWQDDYYIWDCAAGTGNLLFGLTNKYNIYASTLDKQDVEVMLDRIKNGANLLDSHIFQFDFLNDDFSKLPKSLRDIIEDASKRSKLIILINPPYAEGDNREGTGRRDIQISNIHEKYKAELSHAKRELFAQFMMRLYKEVPGCKIAEFSKLKLLTGSQSRRFRETFRAKLQKMFIVPSWTFDNVKGKFPIGFKIWDTSISEEFIFCESDVYSSKGAMLKRKKVYSYSDSKYFSEWIKSVKNKNGEYLGWLARITLNDLAVYQM